MSDMEHFVVLIPDEYGELLVCPLDQVVAAFDGERSREDVLEYISSDCCIDSFKPSAEQLARVLALNETGDAGQYWDRG